jgi:hypothetical protein
MTGTFIFCSRPNFIPRLFLVIAALVIAALVIAALAQSPIRRYDSRASEG